MEIEDLHSSTIDKLKKIMQKSERIEILLVEALELIQDVFACDRSWLLYPCDPKANSWRVPMERTRKEWPGAMELGVDIPIDDEKKKVMQLALDNDRTLCFSPGMEFECPQSLYDNFHVLSEMVYGVKPEGDQAWLLGVHYCEESKVWSAEEIAIFDHIGRLMGSALGALLVTEENQASEARLRNVFDMSSEAILIINDQSRIYDANANAASLFGIPKASLTAQNLFLMSPEQQADGRISLNIAEELLQRATIEVLKPIPWIIEKRNGEQHTCELHLGLIPESNPDFFRVTIVDVAMRKAAEDRVNQDERTKSLGNLAGGIAHDFNNILSSVLLLAKNSLRKISDDSPVKNNLELIKLAAEKASDLTQQLLTYSHREEIKPQRVLVNDCIESLEKMILHMAGFDIQVSFNLSELRSAVMADTVHLTQIILNLISNARDVVGVKSILIETSEVTLGKLFCAQYTNLKAGEYCVIKVKDDGPGIPKDVVKNIFEPFCTTKEAGKGTGLGLATVSSIAKQHKGVVTVETKLDQGTTFLIYLPLIS